VPRLMSIKPKSFAYNRSRQLITTQISVC